MKPDVIIIGGGAAGLMCAITAAKRGRRVQVLEHNDRVGKKILISGGGRCNFTNLHANAENYLSQNPDFCKSALARFKPQDFIAWVERHGIAYHEKKLGQLFCDQSSSEITEMLLRECEEAGVEILLNTRVLQVERGDGFLIRTQKGVMQTDRVVVATGGLSFPKLGVSDLGYRLAKQFDLKVTEIRPGLVPLTLSEADSGIFGNLSGISLDTLITCGQGRFRENILFTHRGISGPAVLQISSFWKEGQTLTINLFPDGQAADWLLSKQGERAELSNILAQRLPLRFAQAWCAAYAPSQPLNRFSAKRLREIAHALEHWELMPQGTEGYAKAEVTLGGIDTSELSSKTLESKKIPGLFFVGEVIDVTGHLGGFNFQWAWASGSAAGQALAAPASG